MIGQAKNIIEAAKNASPQQLEEYQQELSAIVFYLSGQLAEKEEAFLKWEHQRKQDEANKILMYRAQGKTIVESEKQALLATNETRQKEITYEAEFKKLRHYVQAVYENIWAIRDRLKNYRNEKTLS